MERLGDLGMFNPGFYLSLEQMNKIRYGTKIQVHYHSVAREEVIVLKARLIKSEVVGEGRLYTFRRTKDFHLNEFDYNHIWSIRYV